MLRPRKPDPKVAYAEVNVRSLGISLNIAKLFAFLLYLQHDSFVVIALGNVDKSRVGFVLTSLPRKPRS